MQKFWVLLYRASGVSLSVSIALLIMLPPGSPYEANLLRAFLVSFVLFIVSALFVKRRRGDEHDGAEGDLSSADMDD
jgi:hypothetical protein